MSQETRQDFKKWVVDLVFDAQQGLCSGCGASLESEPFQIHHKDGDHANNELGNCELLCVKCHHATFSKANNTEDSYLKHKAQEQSVLDGLNVVLKQAADPASKMSGATLEKLLEGFTQSLRVSRNATDVDYGMMKTPVSILMERGYNETRNTAEIYTQGYMDGVKATVAKLGDKQ